MPSTQAQPWCTPKTLKPSIQFLPFLAMKDRPPLSSYGAIYVPPHHRLRSVVTSANYTSPASKLRENQGALLNPRAPAAATPNRLPEQVPYKDNSRYVSAYDDEEGFIHEFEPSSLTVSLSFTFAASYVHCIKYHSSIDNMCRISRCWKCRYL